MPATDDHPGAAGRRRRPRRRTAIWLRTDEGTLTFGGAAGQVARLAERLRDAGVGRGDLVVVTARTTPPYLLCWLALASPRRGHGADRPGRHRRGARRPGRPGRSRGSSSPTRRCGHVVVEAAAGSPTRGARHRRLCSATGASRDRRRRVPVGRAVGPDDLAVLIPTSGTTGRSKLVMQTHRAYAMAGEGFPYWMELDRERPADDVAAAVPHQRAGVLGAGLARLRRRPGPAAAVLGQRVPRLGPAARRDRVQRDRRDARDPDAPAGRGPTTPRPTCGSATPARPRPASGRRRSSERFGLRVVCGYAMSESPYGLIWRHGTRPFGTLGSPRQHPTLGTVNEARVVDDDGRDARRRARPASCCCATRPSRRATGRCRRRPRRRSSTAGCTPATW